MVKFVNPFIEYKDLPHLDIDIDVYFDKENLKVSAAKKITPIYDTDGNINDQARADYDDFIESVILELEYSGLAVIEETTSNSSVTSHYFILADEESYNKDDIHWVIFLRVSDHYFNPNSEEVKQWSRQYRREKADSLGVKYKPASIVVNNETQFNDYDQAVEFVCHKIDEFEVYLKRKERNSRKNTNSSNNGEQ